MKKCYDIISLIIIPQLVWFVQKWWVQRGISLFFLWVKIFITGKCWCIHQGIPYPRACCTERAIIWLICSNGSHRSHAASVWHYYIHLISDLLANGSSERLGTTNADQGILVVLRIHIGQISPEQSLIDTTFHTCPFTIRFRKDVSNTESELEEEIFTSQVSRALIEYYLLGRHVNHLYDYITIYRYASEYSWLLINTVRFWFPIRNFRSKYWFNAIMIENLEETLERDAVKEMTRWKDWLLSNLIWHA